MIQIHEQQVEAHKPGSQHVTNTALDERKCLIVAGRLATPLMLASDKRPSWKKEARSCR